jgi:hypothetical protein
MPKITLIFYIILNLYVLTDKDITIITPILIYLFVLNLSWKIQATPKKLFSLTARSRTSRGGEPEKHLYATQKAGGHAAARGEVAAVFGNTVVHTES